jgi:hypothetical protein
MKLSNRQPESLAVPTAVQPAKMPLERLREWQGTAEGAYSANTLRAQKADGAIFQAFCDERGESYLPADPTTIRAFIEHEVKAGKKPATIRRYHATIGRAHIGAGLLNPCSGEAVRLALKKMAGRRRRGRRRRVPWAGMRSSNLSRARAPVRCLRIVKVGGFLALNRFNHRSIDRNLPLVEHCFVGVFRRCSA